MKYDRYDRAEIALFIAFLVLLVFGAILATSTFAFGDPAAAAAPTAAQFPPDDDMLEKAIRKYNFEQLTPPPAPPPATGLWGEPFAPAGLDDCAEMNFYREQWGLPGAFAGIGWRESNCRNEEGVKTFCCWGYWQMYTSLHLQSNVLRPKMHACGVFSHHDLNSDVPIEKQRQACAAAALHDTAGTSPWSATR